MTKVFRFLEQHPRAHWLAPLLGAAFALGAVGYVVFLVMTFEGR